MAKILEKLKPGLAEEFAAQAEKLAPFPWNGKKGARS